MVEIALNENGERVYAEDASKGQGYSCPCCHQEVILKAGEDRIWHFAHKPKDKCTDTWDYDMSEWHRNWQRQFPLESREIVLRNYHEDNIECHRADVLIGDYVIEFQHSPISRKEFDARNRFYVDAGYKVIWVFDWTRKYVYGPRKYSENEYEWRSSYEMVYLENFIPVRDSNIFVLFQFKESDLSDTKDEEYLQLIKRTRTPSGTGKYGFSSYKRFWTSNEIRNKTDLIRYVVEKLF